MINDLLKLAKKHKNIVVLTAGGDNMCEDFAKYFPERFFNFGQMESTMCSAAAGFALTGKMPIVIGDLDEIFSRGHAQILDDICKPNLNVKFVGKGDGRIAGGIDGMEIVEGGLCEMVERFGPMCIG